MNSSDCFSTIDHWLALLSSNRPSPDTAFPVQRQQTVAKLPVRLLALAVKKPRDMALPGLTGDSDLGLCHAGIHDFLNDFCPVHIDIITIVIASVNTIVIAWFITIAI